MQARESHGEPNEVVAQPEGDDRVEACEVMELVSVVP